MGLTSQRTCAPALTIPPVRCRTPKTIPESGAVSLPVDDDSKEGAAAVVVVLSGNGTVVAKQATTVGGGD